MFFLCVFIHFVSPLIFLTHFTQNPYSIQIFILQSSLFLAGGATGLALWRARPLRWTQTPVDFPLVLFGLWALATWGLSYVRHVPFFRPGIFHEGTRGAIFLWVNGVGAFFLSTQMGRDPRIHRLRRLMLGVGGISAAYCVLQYFGVDPIWGGSVNPFAGRPVSTYGNPNFLSSVLVLFLPLALQECLTARTAGGAVVWGGLGILFSAALTATMTRSSWIGAGVGLTLYLLLEQKTVRQAIKRFGIWLSTLSAVVLFWPASHLGSSSPISRMTELWNGVTGHTVYASWHQRLLIWRSAWNMWKECPWAGKGWGLFELFFPYDQGALTLLEPFRTFRTHANNAHQLFLEMGSQTGLIGLGLFLWIVLLTLTAHQKSSDALSPDRKSLAAAFLAGIAGMAADNVFGNVSLFFAVPGFLFFWVWGQWATIIGKETVVSPPPFFRKCAAIVLVLIGGVGINMLFRNIMAEAAFFRGSSSPRENGRSREEELLLSQQWKRYDVHNAFELGNLYLQREENARAQGFQQEVQTNAEKALDAYTDALRSNPSYDEIFEARATVLRLLNRADESERDLQMARLINPLKFDGKMLEQMLARDLENVDAWAGLKRIGKSAPPEILEGKRLLAAVRDNARTAQWKEARDCAEQLIALLPNYPLPYLMAADTAAQLGDDEIAIKRYREFLQKSPGHPDARENLAKVLDRQGRAEEARRVRGASPSEIPATNH